MNADDVISLRDYLIVLRRQRWVIAVTTVLVVAAAVAVSLVQTPIYEAEADVVVEPLRRTQDVTLEQLLVPSAAVVETERVIMLSRPVTERVIERLGAGDPQELREQVRVEVVRDTRVVRVIAADPDPVAAASIANAYAESYLDYRRNQAVEELLAARANLEQRADQLREQIEALDAQIDQADEDDAGSLVVQRDTLLAQLSQVVGQTSELGEAVDVVTGGGDVIEPAVVPSSPVSPRPLRTGALAVVLGLLLGVGFAFLRDHLDDVVRDEADFKRATGALPILGRIPRWDDPAASDRLVTIVEPSSVAGESYRELSAGVRFLLLAERDADPQPGQDVGRSVMVTSALVGDGKTSTAANLAVAAARVGLRTVLVDADLRRPMIGRRFGLGRTTGLSDVLLSGGEVADHVVRVGIDNLLVLAAGTIPPNPNELLASPAMRALHRRLVASADLVVYDTPAALAVPDALELGQYVDLTVLVGRAGVTGRRQLAAVIERLVQTGVTLGGTVLNGIDPHSDGYYYKYYVEGEEASARGRRWRRRPAEDDDAAAPGVSEREPEAYSTVRPLATWEPPGAGVVRARDPVGDGQPVGEAAGATDDRHDRTSEDEPVEEDTLFWPRQS